MSSSATTDSPLIVQAKNKAKHLKSILKPRLPDISHGECLNIISKLERERDWNTYLTKLKQSGSDGNHSNEVDSYIIKTALPLIANTAAKYNLKIIADSSEIENGTARYGIHNPRKISMRIEPLDQAQGETFCEPVLDVSMTSFQFSSGELDVCLNFIFPKEGFSVATQILSGNKVIEDADPQITRFVSHHEQSYLFAVNVSGISDTVDHGFSVLNDPNLHRFLQKDLDRFFSRYSKAVKAYAVLHGKWSNKKYVADFENALWKMYTDEPPYMSASTRFYSTTIAGLQMYGVLGSQGPYVVGGNSSEFIGVCSIVHLKEGEHGKPEGYYIAKYGDKWQAGIYLKGFNESDVDRVTAEFGIPRGRYPENDTTFYQGPAFDALCTWVDGNPQHAKRVGQKGGRYLLDWYEQVLSKTSAKFKKPTTQDFLNAIEKEPSLIDFGIHCSTHIDRKKTVAENREDFRYRRESFTRSGYREFSVCCEWLQGCLQRKTINSSHSSYNLKHMVEAWAKKTGKEDYYVSNGAFIAAAIHMGFNWKQDFDSPNVRFNISQRSPAIIALDGNSIAYF